MNECRISLTFICVDCGSSLVIRIPKEPGVYPGIYPWRCMNCQGSWPGGAFGGSGRGFEPTKQEEE